MIRSIIKRDYIRAYEKKRNSTPKRKSMRKNIIKKEKLEHPEKAKARQMVNRYLRNGKIQKPGKCQICDSEESLDAHHYDYTKPLDVIWCCKLCHHQLHSLEINRET